MCDKKIEQDGNINDYMCRATSYGFAFANLDSIKSFYKEDEYIMKEEALNLALIDFNRIIELLFLFAQFFCHLLILQNRFLLPD